MNTSVGTGTGTGTKPHTAVLPLPFPGETLREDFMEPLGLSITEVAKAIGVTPATVSLIVRGKRSIRPEMALRLARYTGASAEFWIHLQTLHDLRAVRLKMEGEINRQIVPLEKAA